MRKWPLGHLHSKCHPCCTPSCLSTLLQIVANVPRVATKPIETPGAPKVPSGCPFSACWGGMSLLDPAVKGEETVFRWGLCLCFSGYGHQVESLRWPSDWATSQ